MFTDIWLAGSTLLLNTTSNYITSVARLTRQQSFLSRMGQGHGEMGAVDCDKSEIGIVPYDGKTELHLKLESSRKLHLL